MDPGDPKIKEEILDAAIKLENIDKLIKDFDDDEDDEDEDFEYFAEDDDDDSDYDYKSSTVSQNLPKITIFKKAAICPQLNIFEKIAISICRELFFQKY